MTTSTVVQEGMAKKRRILAMVWAPEEARTEMYARNLNAPIYHVHYLLYKRPWVAPLKYIAQALKTWLILFRERPRVVYITNPPVFAPMCVWLYCLLTGNKFIMDTHSPALYMPKWAWSVPLQRFLIKRALMNVTDQLRFKEQFEEWGGKAVILEKPPKLPPPNAPKDLVMANGFFDVLVVNTFASDEPLDPILDAARQFENARFFITGDTSMAKPGTVENAPKNCIFTGYLRGSAYWDQIYRSRAVMVLTTFPYSLLGGAQDGAAISKPLILSKQPALEEYFTKGAVFVENTVQGIAGGVRAVITREDALSREVEELIHEKDILWHRNFAELTKLIEEQLV
jgi:glycosyltransferase involved in cell wall biosynthesis